MSSVQKRIIIIGAGHNGLVAAWYLAKAGFAPLVLERRDVVGGCAVTEEICPGFRCSTVAHLGGPLLPRIAKDLQLERHGLAVAASDLRVLALDPERQSIRIFDDPARTAVELAKISARDASRYRDFQTALARIGRMLAPLLAMRPPDIDNLKTRDYLDLGRLALNFRGLDKKQAYQLLRWVPMPAADLVSEWFETDLLRAVVASRGIFGTLAGPRSAGTSSGILLQAAIDGQAVAAAPFFKGSIGALTQAIADAASSAGVQIRTGTPVRRIVVKDGSVSGVALSNGEEIPARAVISNADPPHTFLELIDPSDLSPSFLAGVRNYRCTGVSAKVNLALSGLPAFPDLAPRIHIGPGVDYLERAFDAAKYGDFSPAPYMDITIPSLVDGSLAPEGRHVMSIYAQYAPYHLKNGDWNARREEFGHAVLRTLSQYAPNIAELIIHRQIITPVDLEQTYGLSGGHILHGEQLLDQLFVSWARYRTPIRGLYLCGAGTHPRAGITGASGANAARQIRLDLAKRIL